MRNVANTSESYNSNLNLNGRGRGGRNGTSILAHVRHDVMTSEALLAQDWKRFNSAAHAL